MTKKRVILFKKRDIDDQYDELFLKNDYIPHFIPVLDHKSENIDVIKNIILKGPKKCNYTGLILTSHRSAQAMGEAIAHQETIPNEVIKEWNELPMYIVGPQTAKVLHELTLFKGHLEDKTHWIIAPRAAELTELIIHDQRERNNNIKLLFLAGDKRRDFIPTELSSAKLEFDEVQSYITCPHSDLSSQIKNLPPSADWLVYFSPSGLKFISSSIDPATRQKFLATSVKLAAIGPTTADYIQQEYGHSPHITADKPDAQHLLDAIAQYDI